MPDPVLRRGSWWVEREDGAWLRWDESSGTWVSEDGPPPPPPDRGGFRDIAPLRPWAVGLLIIAVVLDAVALFSGAAEQSLLDRIGRGEAVTLAEAEANDARQAAIGIAQLIMLVVTGIAFIRWFHAAYANLPALGARTLRFRPGWAIGGWFVPILHVWRLKQIANDLWRASDPQAPPEQGDSWRGKRIPGVLTAWWLCWVFANALYTSSFRRDVHAETLSEIQGASALTLAADVLSVVAGVLAIVVVNRITDRQLARVTALGMRHGGASPRPG